MREIHKKTYPAMFAEILSGRKTFDLRLADFDCQPGDVLVLDEVSGPEKIPTGRSLRKKVGYVLKTKELDYFDAADIAGHGFQVMSLLDEDSV